MDAFRDVLLAVWREACRHIELTESIGAMARMVAPHLPASQLVVREFDAKRHAVHTVAAVPGERGESPTSGRVPCSPEQLRQWIAWCRQGQVGLRRPGTTRLAAWMELIPGPPDRGALVGPLSGPDGPRGVAVAIAKPGAEVSAAHRQMFRAMLEPLATALDNDGRVRELKALREAAEADRRSLLTRLGRRGTADVVVGATSGLRLVIDRVNQVAGSDVPVLIFGEPGSGKEVIARAIHAASPRAGGPFIRVNCGSLTPQSADAELFGQPASAGADDEKDHGWMERADGGTLFLDQIGTLPLGIQARLQRVLTDGAIERAGDGDWPRIDVRFVVASDEDLAGLVRDGRFREDLWYRLAAFPILLPPLRERAADIGPLARHFAQRASIRFGLPLRLPSDDDVALLRAYPWPGNVRELAAVIDRAALLGHGERLDVAGALGAAAVTPARAPASAAGPPAPFRSLDEAIRDHIQDALALAGGRIEGPRGAAALLGINPHTLRARMRKLGVEWNRYRSPLLRHGD